MNVYRPYTFFRVISAAIIFLIGLYFFTLYFPPKEAAAGSSRAFEIQGLEWVILTCIAFPCTTLLVRSLLMSIKVNQHSIRFRGLLRTKVVQKKDIFELAERFNSDGGCIGYAILDQNGRDLAKISLLIPNLTGLIAEIKEQIATNQHQKED